MSLSQQKKNLLLIIAVSQSFFLSAQTNLPKYELGLGISGFVYQGDLTPEQLGSFKTMRMGITLYGARLLSQSMATRTNLAIGGLRGDDALYAEPEYRRQRNFNFRTPVFELSQLLVWSPLKTNYNDKGFAPYLFGGVGLSFLKIRRDWSKYNAEYFDPVSDVSTGLAKDSTHATPRVIPVIPLGVGMRYGISQRLAVSIEASYRLAYTDYIDGFSKAANPARNDHYHTTTVGLIYRLGKKNTLACPVIRN